MADRFAWLALAPPPSSAWQCRPPICGEAHRFEEISRFNLWRLVSCSVRRKHVAVGTADPRKQVTVGTANRQR